MLTNPPPPHFYITRKMFSRFLRAPPGVCVPQVECHCLRATDVRAQGAICQFLLLLQILSIILRFGDGGDTFLRNVCS
jgi:hypothetical protein